MRQRRTPTIANKLLAILWIFAYAAAVVGAVVVGIVTI